MARRDARARARGRARVLGSVCLSGWSVWAPTLRLLQMINSLFCTPTFVLHSLLLFLSLSFCLYCYPSPFLYRYHPLALPLSLSISLFFFFSLYFHRFLNLFYFSPFSLFKRYLTLYPSITISLALFIYLSQSLLLSPSRCQKLSLSLSSYPSLSCFPLSLPHITFPLSYKCNLSLSLSIYLSVHHHVLFTSLLSHSLSLSPILTLTYLFVCLCAR